MWRSTLHPAPFGLRPTVLACLLAGAAALLAGCNDVGNPMAAGPVTAGPGIATGASAPASGFRLPPGAACTGEIDRFQAVVKDDLSTGNVEQKVYDQIQGDLRRAASACSAGKGGEAHAIVAATKARHGYRA